MRHNQSDDLVSYSEYASAIIIGELISRLAGRPVEHVLAELLEQADLADTVAFDVPNAWLQSPIRNIGFYHIGLPDRDIVNYSDALPMLSQYQRYAFGGFASAGRPLQVLSRDRCDAPGS